MTVSFLVGAQGVSWETLTNSENPERNLGDGRGEVEWTQTDFGVRGSWYSGKTSTTSENSILVF